MIARGFKPVGWVAAVGTAALGCYMLSLRVASERADLSSLEGRIVATQQQIRSLQTELGTRGRLQQLEQWNDQVLALAAPVSAQYLSSDVQLARFGAVPATPLEAPAEVRMAAAETVPAPAAPAAAALPAPRHAVADARTVASPPPPLERPVVQRASLTVTAAAAPAPARPQAAPATPPRTRADTAEPQSTSAPARLRTAAAEPQAASPARTAATPVRIRTASAEPRATVTSRAPATPARARTATASGRPSALLDDRTLREIGTAARAERGGGTRD